MRDGPMADDPRTAGPPREGPAGEGPAGTTERLVTTHSPEALERRFEAIVAPERDRLLAYLFGICGDREAALDLAQETFLAAWRGLAGLRGESGALTWLVGIARRTHRRWLRREGRRACLLAEAGREGRLGGALAGAAPPGDAAGARAGAPPADAALLAAEREARVRRAVLALSPERRETVVLHYFVGMAVAEVARATATSEGTVKSRLARARAALARALAEDLSA